MIIQSLDIFCDVIDNFGDIGFVYRFAKEFLRHNTGVKMRVFVNNMSVFSQINHSIDSTKAYQTIDSVTYINTTMITAESFASEKPADILIEAFGCQIPDYIMKRAYTESTLLINLEYLSAENWVDGYHLKESLLPEGTLKKYFFMPGFTEATGGVILNSSHPALAAPSANSRINSISKILSPYSVNIPLDKPNVIIGTVFTYTRNFSNFFNALEQLGNKHVILLVFGEKSKEGILYTLKSSDSGFCSESCLKYKNSTILFLPNLHQEHYDKLLYFTDFNIVRGEDSLVRAILAGNPFIWNAYIQKQKYQIVKVEALCQTMEQYFDYSSDFIYYHNLMIQFNNIEKEDPSMKSDEQFQYFFENLQNFKHATEKMCYFLHHHCNLIEKTSSFISNFQKF